MKNLRIRTLLAVTILTLGSLSTAHGQNMPTDDAYTNTALPTTNYGSATTLSVVNPSETAYITFDLSSIPAGYTSANLAKASLKLYVNAVTTAGSFNVDFVNGTWTEKTITASLSPALGTTIAASVPLTKANAHDYIVVDVTSAVAAWLDGTQANDGLALVGNSPLSASFDSKENTGQSHPPELDIVLTGNGTGTITGVTAGSGLSGGGTKGNVTLSLLNTCASGQVLFWNGTAWECGNAGTGTITGVTAGTDLTGGGTGGNVTLNLDTTRVPQLNAANAFTGNQSVTGNLSATGVVTGNSYQIGSNLFAFGTYSLGNAFLGFAGNTTMTGGGNTGSGFQSLHANTTGTYNVANGYQALFSNTSGSNNTASGNGALLANTTGQWNTANGADALYFNTTGSYNTANGVLALNSNTTGTYNTATGVQALAANTTGNANTASGYQSLSKNTTGASNTATGIAALYTNTTGTYNTASGANALAGNTTGNANTATGTSALQTNSTGFANTATGVSTLGANSTGSSNTADGESAMYSNSTGSNNTASGYEALFWDTIGANNTANGFQALYFTTAGDNTANGYQALYSNTSGNYNTAGGEVALYSNTTGTVNTGVGYGALFLNTTGSYNTALGYSAGTFTSTNLTNATAIGAYAAVQASNSLVLGSIQGVNFAPASTNVGIGTTAPQARLDVAGNGLEVYTGDPACGSGTAAIGFGSTGFQPCSNYALRGDAGGNLYINSSSTGWMFFDHNNSGLMSLDPSGNLSIKGNLSKGGGSFKIDHPLDPANKYLYHSFVESPDMMNIYNGLVTLDAHGAAWITMPDYFEALNRDFRYQLTSIGRPQPNLYVQKELAGNRFKIAGGKPGGKVSWQVTGVRQDAWANAHRIPVEVEKPAAERGHYLHPELYDTAGVQAEQ